MLPFGSINKICKEFGESGSLLYQLSYKIAETISVGFEPTTRSNPILHYCRDYIVYREKAYTDVSYKEGTVYCTTVLAYGKNSLKWYII